MRSLGARLFLAAGAVALLCMPSCRAPLQPGDSLPGLTADERDRFRRGRVEFEWVFTPETGFGPLFNADSCAACHEDPVAGGPGDEVELHVSAFDPASGTCDPLVDEGGVVIQQMATPTLAEFNAGTFPIEQGITVPATPTEERIGGAPIPEGVDPVPEPEIDQ